MAQALPQAPRQAFKPLVEPHRIPSPNRKSLTGAFFSRSGSNRGRRLLAVTILLLALPGAGTLAQSRAARKTPKPEHLAIVNARFLDSLDGYPLPPNSSFYPGEVVYLVFNLGGFHVSEYEYQMKVSYRIDFIGAQGAPFATSEAGVIAEEVYPQDENWMPIVRTAPRIPFHAEKGTYKIEIYAKDELRPQDEDRLELSFEVLGKDVGDADKLTIRNFEFQQTEGGKPVETPAYRPGDTLWGSFYITGFELSENNAFDVDSRLEVLDPDGEVMYSFTPQQEEGQSYYPRRWLPGRFRVDLDKNIPPGDYVLVLLVEDRLGKQESRTRYPFVIR